MKRILAALLMLIGSTAFAHNGHDHGVNPPANAEIPAGNFLVLLDCGRLARVFPT